MTTALVRYEAARHALAEAHRIDEVKDIRDKAEAMAAYARQAKDTELIQYATEIKVRAERRCGELLAQTAKNTGVRVSGRMVVERSDRHTLAEMGITKDQSSRYQQLAAMPDEHFETAVATAKETAGQVTTAFMLREAKKRKAPAATPLRTKKAKQQREELNRLRDRGYTAVCTHARWLLDELHGRIKFSDAERDDLRALRAALNEVHAQGGLGYEN
jgi:hypothetical protein